MFDLQPTLNGSLVSLRPLRESDFDEIYQVASDPLIWEQHPEPLRYQEEIFKAFFAVAIKSKSAFAVIERTTGRTIGSSRYSRLDLERSSVEVGYTFIAREFWGKGYNPEMKKLMLDHAFQYVDNVDFYIGENNLRSRKAVEKLGAKLFDQIVSNAIPGRLVPAVVYRLEKPPMGKQILLNPISLRESAND